MRDARWSGDVVFAHLTSELVMRVHMLVGLVLLLACRDTPAEPAGSVRVSAEVSRSAFRPGEPVTIRVRAMNVGAAPVRLVGSGCPVWFEILSGATPVAPGETACAMIAVVRDLAPGETHTVEYEWHGGSHPSPTEPAVALPPGAYTVRGRVKVHDAIVRGAPVGVQILR
jgi:hypothetical protein